MKKSLFICAVCAAIAATACCGGKQQKVTAVVAGPDKVAAVVIEYAETIDAESVCPEAFVVEGKEVVCAKLVEPTKVCVALKKDCCKAGKPECCEKKAECGEAKPECCQKKAECSEAKPECCKEGAECCVEGAECCKPGKPECCEKKAECGEKKCDIPVPDVAVKQVADIKTADGKVVKAWKKAVKATAACPAPCPKHKCGEPKECCKEKAECGQQPCNKPADEQCPKCKEQQK